MGEQSVPCAATTRSGERCKNRALPESAYCRVHQPAAAPESAPKPARKSAPQPAPKPAQRLPVEAMAQEFNKLAAEVAQKSPDYAPPPFSPAAMVNVLKANAEQLAAFLPLELIKDIIRNLEGTRKEDLLDPDTWKGLWYILTYSLATQSKGVLEEVAKRLAIIPGMDLVMQFTQSVMESPRDLLSIDTWKGAAMILNAAVQANASSLKRKVLGGEDAG